MESPASSAHNQHFGPMHWSCTVRGASLEMTQTLAPPSNLHPYTVILRSQSEDELDVAKLLFIERLTKEAPNQLLPLTFVHGLEAVRHDRRDEPRIADHLDSLNSRERFKNFRQGGFSKHGKPSSEAL